MAKTRKSRTILPNPPEPTRLLAWYDKHGRKELPWRSHDGCGASPYHTWIAEVMLQQTTVAAVIPYYHRFITRWPNVKKLAAADENDVLKEWAGLGYYSRARNLHGCAQAIVAQFGGIFPTELKDLRALPGIGDYTANAIRAIAFDREANVVDGNVERVMARLFAVNEPTDLPQTKKILRTYGTTLAPKKRPGDYAQALMDLGATVCTPKKPDCARCPWQQNCRSFQLGLTGEIPARSAKKARPELYTTALVLHDAKGRVFLRQRPREGLLGGMWECPSTEWLKTRPDAAAFCRTLEKDDYRPQQTSKPVKHVFTHLVLYVDVVSLTLTGKARPSLATWLESGAFFTAGELPALSGLTQKILAAAGKGET